MKVVCVDASGNQFLSVGGVYTIRGLRTMRLGDAGLYLEEVSHPHSDAPFFARRFRPAVSPKAEISFTTGAPKDSERWDNRRPVSVPHRPNHVWRV